MNSQAREENLVANFKGMSEKHKKAIEALTRTWAQEDIKRLPRLRLIPSSKILFDSLKAANCAVFISLMDGSDGLQNVALSIC